MKRVLRGQQGMTLLEVVIAVAIFSLAIGISAQVLMQFYVSMDVQEQRIEAVNSCRSVLSAVREKRSSVDNFPADLLAWVTTNNTKNWTDYSNPNSGKVQLKGHTVKVNCYNQAGVKATNTTIPLVVQITAEWKDRRGRTIDTDLVTVLASE